MNVFTALLLSSLCFSNLNYASDVDWSAYGRDAGGTRYSPLAQITRQNVTQLKLAWEYHTGALKPVTDLNRKAAFEATPILVDGTLYLSTPFDQVIALDPASGKERWVFDPKIDRSHDYSEVTSRGVSTWVDPQTHKRRIFIGTIDARLISLDAATGKPSEGFAEIDLTKDVGLKDRGDYQVTSPPAVVGDLVITGSSIGDNRRTDVERGIVRAFDARTGKLRWSFDPLPAGLKNAGAANAWSVLSADPERDLVFVPTGSASPDFYGGQRPGDNGYADSVVAIRASTGKVVWHFQVVHHNLWDYDVASQPTLITFRRGGQSIPAVAVTTKIGHLFVLDRETGKSLLPVEERPVPQSKVPGEEASPTQPFPKYDVMAPQKFTADDAWGITPQDLAWCKARLQGYDSRGVFTPPSLEGVIMFPGNVGGVNWGSAAYEPERGLLVAASNRLSTIVKLIPQEKLSEEVKTARENRFDVEFGRQRGAPYAMVRSHLRAPSGLPCNAPPWGVLIAMDLSTGAKKWEVPLGEVSLGPGKSIPGSLAMGGPMTTVFLLFCFGKVLECASFCAEPYGGKETVLGEISHEDILVYPMLETQRCTIASVAGHAMYERSNPFDEYYAGGRLEMRDCKYEQYDERTVRVTGSRFIPAVDLRVKLEGAGKVGERFVGMVAIRDPYTISRIDEVIAWSRNHVTEAFGETGYDVYYSIFGKNGLMGDWEPVRTNPHEVCITVQAVAPTASMAERVCMTAMRQLFYARLPDVKGTAGGVAFPFDELWQTKPACRWTMKPHDRRQDDPMELFTLHTSTVGQEIEEIAQ